MDRREVFPILGQNTVFVLVAVDLPELVRSGIHGEY
jgi:hypothetical protein